jgi:hypothetical protein
MAEVHFQRGEPFGLNSVIIGQQNDHVGIFAKKL